MTREPSSTGFTRVLLPGAFLFALGCMLVEAFAPFELVSRVELHGLVAGPFVLLAAVLASLWLGVASIYGHERGPRVRREASKAVAGTLLLDQNGAPCR